jgi:hypothetical protein
MKMFHNTLKVVRREQLLAEDNLAAFEEFITTVAKAVENLNTEIPLDDAPDEFLGNPTPMLCWLMTRIDRCHHIRCHERTRDATFRS